MEPVKIEPIPEPAPVSVYADLYAKHGHTMRTKPVADLPEPRPRHGPGRPHPCHPRRSALGVPDQKDRRDAGRGWGL